MPAQRKPTKGKYRRRRQRDLKAERFARYYGCDAYVEAIHSHQCTVYVRARPGTKTPCSGRIEAAHRIKKTRLESRGWRDCLPLCTQHHGEQEVDATFFERHGIDDLAECDRYADMYGHRVPVAA